MAVPFSLRGFVAAAEMAVVPSSKAETVIIIFAESEPAVAVSEVAVDVVGNVVHVMVDMGMYIMRFHVVGCMIMNFSEVVVVIVEPVSEVMIVVACAEGAAMAAME